MANTDKHLKPLIDICNWIVSGPDDCKPELTELKQFAAKGAYYECHSFKKLLELLAENPKLKAAKKAEVFKALKSLLQERSSNKDYIVSQLHAFIADLKKHPHLIDGTFLVCTLEGDLPNTNYDSLIRINEILLYYADSNDTLNIIWSNYSKILCNQDNVTLKQWQSFNRSVSLLASQDKLTVAEEFLRKTLLQSAGKKKLKALSEDDFAELFKILKTMGMSALTPSAMGVCANLCQSIRKLITNEEHTKCLDILAKGFQLIQKDSIAAPELTKLSSFYPNPKESTSTVLVQNTTVLLAKMLELNNHLIEPTTEAFEAYHKLSFKFFHVFRDLKNTEGVFPCCSDLKRHRVYDAIRTSFAIATKLANDSKFDQTIARSFQYQVNYCLQVCNDTKCSKKRKLQDSLFNRLYIFMFAFLGKSEVIRNNIIYLDLYIKVLFKLWDAIGDHTDPKFTPDDLAYEIYYRSVDAPGQASTIYSTSASALLSLLSFKRKTTGSYVESAMDVKKVHMKIMMAVRHAVKHLNFGSVAEFLKSKYFVDPMLDGSKLAADGVELLLIEACAVVRHDVNEDPEKVAKLYSELLQSTDSNILAEACQGMKDSVLKFIDAKLFEKVNQTIGISSAKQFNFKASLAMGLNSYSNYFVIFEAVSKELKNEGTQLEKIHLQREIEQLKHLNSSLAHFTDVVHHLMKNPKDVSEIFSMRRLQGVLNNMAMEYLKRGIKYKDIEAFTVLWHLAMLDGQSILTTLNIATFFLDHQHQLKDLSGNYVRVSKKLKPLTIDEVIATTNELLDNKFIPEFEAESLQVRGCIFSYLLSLWVYSTTNGRAADGFKRWGQFNMLWNTFEVPAGSYRDTILSKIYFSVVEINLKCFNRYLHSYLRQAINLVVGISIVDGNFISQFCMNYYRITLAAINYSNNRLVEMNHYEVVMLSVIAMATKKGYCLKYIDLLSLSITRYLNMERADLAMAKLKDLTRMLGLKEEILIETPKEAEMNTHVFDFNEGEMHMRKAAVEPKNTTNCEISFIEDRTTELSRRLESFVHKSTCKCEVCQVPQLKFVMFQIGCHYSRLLWVQGTFDASLEFNTFAMEPWREICDKLRRAKDSEFLMINKVEFAVVSIRWLLQCADTLIRLKKYSDAEEVYQEIELLNNKHVVDYDCFRQALHCRKEILASLPEYEEVEKKKVQEHSFSEFLKHRESRKSEVAPTVNKVTKAVDALHISKPVSKEPTVKVPVFATTKQPKLQPKAGTKSAAAKTANRSSKSPATGASVLDEAIYIDSSDGEDSPAPPKLRRTAKKSPNMPSSSTSTAKKPEPTPKRSTRKAKTDKSIEELRGNSESARKTRRHVL